MAGLDPVRLAQWEVNRARHRMIRCEYCEHFHPLEECLDFRMISHTRKREFCEGKNICLICLKPHVYTECPDRGLKVCGHRGCTALTHHELIHCKHRGPISRTMWEGTSDEDPVMHMDEKGCAIAGPSEMGLRKSMDDSGIIESGDEEGEEALGAKGTTEPREATLGEEATERAEALKEALKRLKALQEGDGPLMGIPKDRVPPRAYDITCKLCMRSGKPLSRHSLGDCPQFLVLDVKERERTAIEFACGICLEVEHYVSNCPFSQRECGIYGCKMNHHPLLHRIQYLDPVSPQDDGLFNWQRHQQARQDDALEDYKCNLCQDSHDTTECRSWPEKGPDRILHAVQTWMCVKCLRGEHAYCPADQTVCGINRCIKHHNPFFHGERARDLSWEYRGNGDSWSALTKAHETWSQQLEAVYYEHKLSARRERMRFVESIGSHGPMQIRYEGLFNRLPPYSVRRLQTGEVAMSEATFGLLAESYRDTGRTSKKLTMNSLRHLLLSLDSGVLQDIMKDEFNYPRDDPRRRRMLKQKDNEADESYAFRLAKRAVALELFPPTRALRVLRYSETTDSEPGENYEIPEAESNSEAEPDSEDEDPPAPERRPMRLVLSGNPYEDEGPPQPEPGAGRLVLSGNTHEDEEEADMENGPELE